MGVENELNWEIISLWVGIGVTFLLGLFNLFWGGGMLLRRQKVNIRDPELVIHTVDRGQGVEWVSISCKFILVRVGGAQDLYLESSYLQLNNIFLKEMSPYFDISPKGKVNWSYHPFLGSDYNVNEIEFRTLKINEPRHFDLYSNFRAKNSLKVLEEQMKEAKQREKIKNQPNSLGFLDEVIRRLPKKYMIVWIDGKGKQWNYRIPNRFFSQFLPKSLWWRVT